MDVPPMSTPIAGVDIVLLFIARMKLAAIGIALGVAAALGLTRVLTNLLYEVKPGDLETYVVISAGLAVVALVASYIPARRASCVDPSLAMRAE